MKVVRHDHMFDSWLLMWHSGLPDEWQYFAFEGNPLMMSFGDDTIFSSRQVER